MFKKYIDLYKKIVIPLYYNLYKMDNQQQNNNYKGKIFQKEIIEDYIKGDSLVILSNKYDYNISTIRYYLIKNNISIRSVKQSVKKFQKNKEIIDNNNLHENIIGWILGDGGVRLHKNGTTPFFNYTDKKYDHIKYVENILNSNNIKTNITKNNNTNCYQLLIMIYFIIMKV
jgi:RecA-family ATPase